MNQHWLHTWLLRGILAGLIFLLIMVLTSCATIERDYDACSDPGSYITFIPWQCHAEFNRKEEWFE